MFININTLAMKRIILFSLLSGMLAMPLIAQVLETEAGLKKVKTELPGGWQRGGLISVAFSQASFSNWAAGGKNSISGTGLLSLFADFREQKLAWNNSFDFGYGLMKQGADDMVKTDDKIDLMSKVGMKANEKWFYTGLFNFRSQLMPGYKYPNTTDKISDFLAPAYLVAALGMDYKGVENLSLFAAPLTGRLTIVNNEKLSSAGAFGVNPGEKVRSEFGGYVRSSYKKDINERFGFQTKLDLFSNYLKNPQNIDINWEAMALLKATKFITLSLSTNLLYDDDIIITDKDGKKGPRTQFKEVFGIGLSYKF